MKRITAFLIALSMISVPAAGASVFGTVFEECRVNGFALQLEGEDGSAGAGFAAGLLAEGLGDWHETPGVSTAYSPAKAGAASFLLPGLGQLKLGRNLRSKIYFGLEGAAWIAIGSFLWQGYARKNAYEDYAVTFACVKGTGYLDDYYRDIGDYMNNDGPGGYNEAVRREARDLYYPDIEAMEAYYNVNKYTDSMGWQWRSERAFENYGVLRSGSRSSYRRALYSAVFALALRVVSTVDAVRLARGEDRSGGKHESDVSFDLGRRSGGLSISFKKSF